MNTFDHMKLKDGRNLAFAQYGDSNGKPVIYFHGFPGSRLEAKRFHEIAVVNNYRLIAVDRPGMGLSSIDKKRSILSTVYDIAALADYLEIKKFSIIGHSGGCPFVAACTYFIPERLTGAAIVSGMAPFTNPASHIGMAREQLIASKLVRVFPPLASVMMRITRMMLKKSDKMLEKMIKPLPEVDKAIFRDPVTGNELINNTLEAFRGGLAGTALEMKILLNHWGFELEKINFPVSVWHGVKDAQVPVFNGKLYAQLIPNATLNILENEGHHSLIKNHFEHILKTL